MPILNFFIETFSLKGRMGVKRYWAFTLIHLFLSCIPFILFFTYPVLIMDFVMQYGLKAYLIAIGGVVLYINIVFITLMSKRLHDMNTSAWWMILIWFLGWLPLIGILLFLYISLAPGTKGPNKYGHQPGTNSIEEEIIIEVDSPLKK